MSTYTDQFDRHDVLALSALGLTPWWRQIAREARELLPKQVSRSMLKRLAAEAAAMIDARAVIECQLASCERKDAGPDRPQHAEANLLLLAVAEDDAERAASWHLFAALALWKLCDLYDEIYSSVAKAPAPRNFRWAPASAGVVRSKGDWARVDERNQVTALAIEAGWSCSLGREAFAATLSARSRREERSLQAKRAAEIWHGREGGSRSKRDAIRDAWASGKYSSRDVCADQEGAALGMAPSTARRALRNTPEPPSRS